jgi:hypothetical protein
MPRLAERADALINPLMLKETYQGFRSGALRVIASLALIVPLITVGVYIGVGAYEESEIEEAGRNLFMAIMTALFILGWLIAPVRAAQQLLGEIKSQTIDLIMLTALSPWQLAFGRFQAAVLQVGLLFALTLPFQVACVVIGGVSLETVAVSMGATFAFSLFQCSAALTGATIHLVSRRLGGAATVAALIYGVTHVALFNPALRGSVRGEVVAWVTALICLNTLLCLRLSADLLTPKTVRTLAWSKACLAALLAVLFMPLWLGELSTAPQHEQVLLLSGGLGLLYLLGFAWSTAPAHSSPRWRSVLADGYEATLLYCGALTAPVAIVAAVRGWPALLPILFFVYFVFLGGVAALLHSFLPSAARTAQGYANLVVGLLGLEAAGTGLCMVLIETSGSKPLLRVLSLVFPAALHDLRLGVGTLPELATPLVLGVLSVALARRRNARVVGHG